MLIDFYLDVLPGLKPEHLWATTNPGHVTCPGSTRLRFTVDVPDKYLEQPPDLDLGVVKAGVPANTHTELKGHTMSKMCGFELVIRDDMKSTDIMFVQPTPTVVTHEQEVAALREALAASNKRAQIAERQLNDVVMATSIKLATARMVLSQIKDSTGQLGAAIQGVLDVLPKDNALPTRQEQRRLK